MMDVSVGVPMKNLTNETQLLNYDEVDFHISPEFIMVRKVFHGITACLTIFGNLLCCFVIRRASDFKKATKILLLSYTLSDLFLGIVVTTPSFALLWGDHLSLDFANTACDTIGKAHLTLNVVSILSLLGINIERYLLIEMPLQAPSLITTRRAKIYIGVVCFIAIIFVTLYLLFPPASGTFYDADYLLCRVFNNVHDTYTYISFTLSTTIFVFVPFLLLTLMYARIYWIAHRHNVRFVKIDNAHNPQSNRQPCRQICKKDAKALFTFLIVTGTFVIGWAPIISFMLYKLYTDYDSVYLESIAMIILFSNYWWNIIIYITRNQSFRNSLLRIVASCPMTSFVDQYVQVSTNSFNGSQIQQPGTTDMVVEMDERVED